MFTYLHGFMSTQRAYEEIELQSRDQDFRPLRDLRRWPLLRSFQGWRGTVRLSTVLATLVLVINLIILFTGISRTNGLNGSPNLYEGRCSTAILLSSVWHIAVNIMSSLLLSASNSTMQILNAPTRAEIDLAHNKSSWLDIGIMSLRNLRFIGRRRVTLCVILFLSSIPLHLLFNAAITLVKGAYEYNALLLTHNSLEGAFLNTTVLSPKYSQAQINERQSQLQHLFDLSQNRTLLQKLSAQECLSEFKAQYSTSYSNLLILSLLKDPMPSGEAILNAWLQKIDSTTQAYPGFTCQIPDRQWAVSQRGEWLFPYGCNDSSVLDTKDAPTWQIPILDAGASIEDNYYRDDSEQVVPLGSVGVDQCFAEAADERCSLSLSRVLLSIVVLCNIIKLACFISASRISGFNPIVTTGDAITSFLTVEDNNTLARRQISLADSRTGRIRQAKSSQTGEQSLFIRDQRQYATSSVMPLRLYRSVGILSWAYIIILCCLLVSLYPSMSAATNLGTEKPALNFHLFGTASAGYYKDQHKGSPTANSMVANVPQIILSLSYILLNSILTTMLISKEYMEFGRRRKTLRRSNPAGAQRSSYFLQIPLRYAFPMMTSMALLHWLVSESFFLVDVESFASDGSYMSDDGIVTVGWSPPAMLTAICLGAIILATLFIVAGQKFSSIMPLASTNSLKISAACHPTGSPNAGYAERPLLYGMLSPAEPMNGAQDAAFSAEDVVPLDEFLRRKS